MLVVSKYAKIFSSNMLTRRKYDELYKLAIKLRDFRNEISQYVNKDLLHYLDFSRFDFINDLHKKFSDRISSCFYNQAYTQVYKDYQNKFNAILRRIEFKRIELIGFELYKRNSAKHQKGELKRVLLDRKSTRLTICLSYLARYGKENTLEYLKQQVDKLKTSTNKKDIKQLEYLQSISDKCSKFGFPRLFQLALSRRNRTIKHYSEHPIEYKSLTFGGRSRKGSIIKYNSNYKSSINAFISLSGLSAKSFDIPVKYSKDYHGRMKSFRKKTNDYEYLITFDEYRKQVRIIYIKDGERYIPEAQDKIIGIDVNSKHNLLSLSNGEVYDFDRKLLSDFCELSLKIDNLKSENSEYQIGKRKQRKLDTLKNKITKFEENLIARVCKHLSTQGYHHIVMENLDNRFGKCFVNDENDVNYNRRVKFLGLSSLKDKFEHIARKYDIALSLVQPHYTSKMCSICGCIDDDNRKCQEEFKCVQCGYEANADINAAENIKNRVSITVLCSKLLKQIECNTFRPKPLKKEEIKKVLQSFRNNAMKHSEVIRC